MRVRLLYVALALLVPISAAAGQKPPSATLVGADAYRIQVTIHDATAVAAARRRIFSFTVLEGSQDTIQTGDRIPVKSSGDQFTYVPTGFMVMCQLPSKPSTRPGHLSLVLHLSISTVVAPESGGSALTPVLRTADAKISTVVPLGTATSVAEFKDAAGTTTYDVEVLAAPATP